MPIINIPAIAEGIGLRSVAYGSANNDPGNFIHGRDYYVKALPESYAGMWRPDQSSYIRIYCLQPDNKWGTPSGSGSATWAGRRPYVSKMREWLFASQLLGYPYVDTTNAGATALVRNLPQPLDWGFNLSGGNPTYSGPTGNSAYNPANWVIDSRGNKATNGYIGASPTFASGGGYSTGWTYQDQRSTTSVQRFTHWASEIVKVEGIGGQAQNPDTDQLWTEARPSSAGVPPDEVYTEVRFYVRFEKLPYEVLFANGPYYASSPSQDPAYGGEFSRYVLYTEEAQSKYVQIRGGAVWDTDTSHWGNAGQPGQTNNGIITTANQTAFAAKEGLPILVGENMLTWIWVDVPLRAYNWSRIQSYFGSINNAQFPPAGSAISPVNNSNPNYAPFVKTSYAPFYAFGQETCMLRSASRKPKNNIFGEPLWDITFYFQYSPTYDGYGYWNRLLNTNMTFQRYMAKNSKNFFTAQDFTQLFLA